MALNTLYGRGAITISDDRHTYQAKNGQIQVPDHLVPRVKAHGFTSYPLPSVETPAAIAAPAAPVVALLESSGEKSAAPSASAGFVVVDDAGHWTAGITGDMSGARSYLYGFSPDEYPPADIVAVAGILVNDTSFAARSDSAIEPGQVIHLTVVPFTEPDAKGEMLPAVPLRGAFTQVATATSEIPPAHPQTAAATKAKGRAHTDKKATPASES